MWQWTRTLTNLPKYDDNGCEKESTIEEKDLNNVFYQKTDKNPETKTITNTFEVPDKKISIDITKNWEDTAEQKGKRPTQITVEVTGNGKTYTEVLDVTNAEQGNADTWKATIADLPKYDRLGNEIEYTVKAL